MLLFAPSTTLRVVPLPRFAGEDPAVPLDPPPFTEEGDHAKRGGGGALRTFLPGARHVS
jgi:hypothetical protein